MEEFMHKLFSYSVMGDTVRDKGAHRGEMNLSICMLNHGASVFTGGEKRP